VWASADRRERTRRTAARGAGLAAAAAVAFGLVHVVWSPPRRAEPPAHAAAPASRVVPAQVAVSDTTAASLFVYGQASELAAEDYLDPHLEL
jgi:hypothetical protein